MYYKKWFPDPVLCQMAYDAYWNVARPFIMDYISEGGKMDEKYALFAEAGRTNDRLWGSYPSLLVPSAKPRTTAEDVEYLRSFFIGHIKYLDPHFASVKTLIEAMNNICPYPCDPDIIDGIQAPPASGQSDESVSTARKVIRAKHLYIEKDNETYSVDGKRIK